MAEKKDLKGTKTEKNLLDAFAGESQAMAKYSMYAKVAKKEGYEQIAAIFEETSMNEREHAKLHLKNLEGIKGTIENLQDCIDGENYEHTEMYPTMAKEAREEGFKEIAVTFELISAIEKEHEARYKKLKENIENNKVFEKTKDDINKIIGTDGKVYWKCRNCGHLHEGAAAPKLCPTCKHGQAYFELFIENY